MVLHSAFRMTLPRRYERGALCVNVCNPATPGNVLRLLNVHVWSHHDEPAFKLPSRSFS